MNDQEAYEYYLDPAHLVPAGPARKHSKDGLKKVLTLRISPSLLNQVTRTAVAEGCSVSSWARRVLRDELARGRAEARRPEGLIPGSGRQGRARALPSSLSLQPRTFSCPHLSVGNVTSASCGTCGPLLPVPA